MNRHFNKQVSRDLRRIKRLRRLLSVLLFAAVVAVVRLPVWSYFSNAGRGGTPPAKSEAAPANEAASATVAEAGEQAGETAADVAATNTTLSRETSQQRSPTVRETASGDVKGLSDGEAARLEPPSDLGDVAALASRIAILLRPPPGFEPGSTGEVGEKQPNDPAQFPDRSTIAPEAGISAGQPNQTAASESETRTVRIHNPKRNGGVVHYLVNGAAFSLSPGQGQELSFDAPVEITYDGGGDFGERRLMVRSGVFVFDVSAQHGWQLKQKQGQ